MAEFRFDEETHRYFLEDRELPSVTRVIGQLHKWGLDQWHANEPVDYLAEVMRDMVRGETHPDLHDIDDYAAQAKALPKKIARDAADIGKEVHKWIADFLRNQPPTEPSCEQVKRACDGFLRWWHESPGGVPEVIAVEEPVYHPTYLYAGTPDFIIRRDKFLYVVDIKTGNAFREPELLMQLAAYAEAWDIMCADYETKWIEGCIGVRLDKKTGLVYERNYTDVYEDGVPFSMFLHLLEFYNEAHAK